MAAPSKTWTDIADSVIDVDSPANTDLFTFLRDDLVHSDERIGIPVAPGNRQANHRHRGRGVDGSDFIELTPQENLVSQGDNPASSFTTGGSTSSGDIAFRNFSAEKIIRAGASDDLHITRSLILASILRKIKPTTGKGRFTCSMHMKRFASASGVVGGTLRFGLHTGGTFITGAFVDIDFDDVTEEYKRFFFVSNQITRPSALNIRAQWTADPSGWGTVSNGDQIGFNGGYMVTNGAGLAKWDISHLDGGGDTYDTVDDDVYWWDEIITVSEQSV